MVLFSSVYYNSHIVDFEMLTVNLVKTLHTLDLFLKMVINRSYLCVLIKRQSDLLLASHVSVTSLAIRLIQDFSVKPSIVVSQLLLYKSRTTQTLFQLYLHPFSFRYFLHIFSLTQNNWFWYLTGSLLISKSNLNILFENVYEFLFSVCNIPSFSTNQSLFIISYS